MSCQNCSSKNNGIPKGCNNNGACASNSCNTFTVFNWLNDIAVPDGQDLFPYSEVRFKNGRKAYYKNNSVSISLGDIVAIESNKGHDIGVITLLGELVRIQMKKKNINLDSDDIFKIYRIASQKDIDVWQDSRNKEDQVMVKARQLASNLNLKMKISDVEYQGDGNKITFYYTADERVDFRELIKVFAKEFKVRIEMKQVGLREEASRLGGIGSCGRELCCSTWLHDFRAVNTSAARYQQLSINPAKLSGQCGKLKCCLNYELENYMDALKDFPNIKTILKTKRGNACVEKVDIFKKIIWYSYVRSRQDWIQVSVSSVKKMIKLNQHGNCDFLIEDFLSPSKNVKTL